MDGSHFYCTNYCPTDFDTTGGNPNCAVPAGAVLIFSGVFNDFANVWTDNGITVTAKPAVTVSTGIKPAFERGQYFDGSDNYLELSAFKLYWSFTITGWLRLDNLNKEYTIFEKSKDFPNATVFRATVTKDDGFLKTYLADTDDWTDLSATATTGTNAVVA